MSALQADRPIMLITATPGGGKTALAVQIMKEAVDAGRPLYVMGIPDLLLPHFPCPPIPEWTESRTDPDNPELSLPFFTFPENSLIVLDEAQRVFRLRAAASKVPDHVAAFETVRHTGVTFLLITQHPNFIDSHIRNLVGQHIHLRDVGLLGRRYYEWPECSDPKTFQSAPIKKKFTLPKASFGLYKSASMHIKRNYTMPPALMFLIFALVSVLAGCFYLYNSIDKKIHPNKDKPVLENVQSAASGQTTIQPNAPGQQTPPDPVAMLVEFKPAVPGRPETAPAFDTLRVVKAMPVVVGCIQTPNRCTCQNQQGLDAGLDRLQCEQWLQNPPFDPYTERPRDQPEQSARARAPDGRTDPAKPEQKTPEFIAANPPSTGT